MLRIEKVHTAAIPLIQDLTMRIWPQTYIPIIGEQQVTYMLERFYTADALQKQMTEQGHQFVICHSSDEPVAFASYGAIEPGIYKLHKIYILPNQQGKGIGKYMIGEMARELREKGVKELRLNVNIYNQAAKAFYEKMGFLHVRDEDIDIGGGYYMNDHVLGLPIH